MGKRTGTKGDGLAEGGIAEENAYAERFMRTIKEE
jgi:hypothetical protein